MTRRRLVPKPWRCTCLSALLAAAVPIAAALPIALPAKASEAWPGIRAEVFGARPIHDGGGLVTLKAPYRPDDVRSVPLEAEDRLAEASDGELLMAEQLVKFAGGQASCSAPPVGDPKVIAATMGRMEFAAVGAKAASSHAVERARVALSHPNHTGMVLDPITLLYIPLLMVDRIEARQGGELVFEMTGSITLAQNPAVEFDFVTNGAGEMTVSAGDTSGASWEQRFPIGPAS